MDNPWEAERHTVNERMKRAVAVANALVKAADVSPETVAHARRIAAAIKSEAAAPQPDPGRLKQLLTDLIQLASLGEQPF